MILNAGELAVAMSPVEVIAVGKSFPPEIRVQRSRRFHCAGLGYTGQRSGLRRRGSKASYLFDVERVMAEFRPIGKSPPEAADDLRPLLIGGERRAGLPPENATHYL